MGVRFSQSTIKASFLVQNPDWYRYECTKVMEKPASTGSKNYILVWEGRHSPESKTDEMNGVPVSMLINENADWVFMPIFIAANDGQPVEEDKEYEPKDLVGITLEARTIRGNRQDGTPQNSLVEWRPVRQ